MKFSNAVGLLAGLTAAIASPTLDKKAVQDDVTVVQEIRYVYADCDTLQPKVFIISLVSFPVLTSLDHTTNINSSSLQKPMSGTTMMRLRALLVTSSPRISLCQVFHHSSQTSTVSPTIVSAKSLLVSQKSTPQPPSPRSSPLLSST